MKRIPLVALATWLIVFQSCQETPFGPWNNAYDTYGDADYLGTVGAGGGIIFFKNPNAVQDGWTFLEAAPSNWYSASGDPTAILINKGPIPNTSTKLGSGVTNTDAIVATAEVTSGAALLCRTYSGGGKTDWFLPSKDEAWLLNRLSSKGLGGFKGGDYWTSSSYSGDPDAFTAWCFSLVTGSSGQENGKFFQGSLDTTLSVRPIRRY